MYFCQILRPPNEYLNFIKFILMKEGHGYYRERSMPMNNEIEFNVINEAMDLMEGLLCSPSSQPVSSNLCSLIQL